MPVSFASHLAMVSVIAVTVLKDICTKEKTENSVRMVGVKPKFESPPPPFPHSNRDARQKRLMS
jgi:hypothetical protein